MTQKGIEEKDITKKFDKWLLSQNYMYIAKNDSRNHARSKDDGHPDRIIFLNNRIVINIEFKTPEKYRKKDHGLRKKQIIWCDYLIKNDHYYYICTSAKEAIDIIENKINVKKVL